MPTEPRCLDQKIKENVQRIGGGRHAFAFLGDHLVHGHAAILIVVADEHAAPILADCGVVVVPTGNTILDVVLQSLAVSRVFQPFKQLVAAAFMGPGWNDACQIVVAARVGIDIGLHVHAARCGPFRSCPTLRASGPMTADRRSLDE